jgi:hypothetical protein
MEVAEDTDKSTQPQFSFPEKTSATVKKWQSDFAEQYQKANTLVATARSLPGTAAGGVRAYEARICTLLTIHRLH